MEMKTTKIITITALAVLLSACGATGDSYDNLIVIDGNGQKYQLKHNVIDTYFIRKIPSASEKPYVQEANSNFK